MFTSPFLNMFGRSPLKPLQKHMHKAYATAKLLLPFFEKVMASEWDAAGEARDKIAAYEKEADNLKKDLRLHMPKGLFLPVSRSDILELLSSQDNIANKAKDIAGLVYGRQMQFPAEIRDEYLQFLHHCIDAAHQAHRAISELDELLETGFRGNEVSLVENMIVELDKIEHDTDEMQISVRRHLFPLEKTLSAIDVIFLYKIIEWTGELADRSQTVGGQLLLLLAR